MGIVALSVLVFDRTGSAMATAGLFLGTRFLPALLAPILVAKVEQPPPRFALPVDLLRRGGGLRRRWPCSPTHFSLAGVVALAGDRRRPGADRRAP